MTGFWWVKRPTLRLVFRKDGGRFFLVKFCWTGWGADVIILGLKDGNKDLQDIKR